MEQLKAVVTQIRQTTIQNSNGTFKAGFNVQFTVGPQGPFTIQIPAEQFTAAEVNKRTEAFAAEINQIPLAEV